MQIAPSPCLPFFCLAGERLFVGFYVLPLHLIPLLTQRHTHTRHMCVGDPRCHVVRVDVPTDGETLQLRRRNFHCSSALDDAPNCPQREQRQRLSGKKRAASRKESTPPIPTSANPTPTQTRRTRVLTPVLLSSTPPSLSTPSLRAAQSASASGK